VDTLVADVAVAVVPVPMPLVMKAVRVEGPLRRGPEPEIVVCALGDGRVFFDPDRVAPPKAQGPGHIHVADEALMKQPDGLADVRLRPALRPMLNDALVPGSGLDHLAALEDVMRAGLLDVDVLTGLATPDRGQGVPVVRGGDRQAVHVLIVEHAANVELGLGGGGPSFGRELDPLLKEAFIHVTQGHHANVLDLVVGADVVFALPADSDDGDANLLVGSAAGSRDEHRLVLGAARGRTACHRQRAQRCRFPEKTAAIDLLWHDDLQAMSKNRQGSCRVVFISESVHGNRTREREQSGLMLTSFRPLLSVSCTSRRSPPGWRGPDAFSATRPCRAARGRPW